MIVMAGIAAVLLVRNLYVMLMQLPDEAFQGAIFRIIFFHVPAAWTAFLAAFVSMPMANYRESQPFSFTITDSTGGISQDIKVTFLGP